MLSSGNKIRDSSFLGPVSEKRMKESQWIVNQDISHHFTLIPLLTSVLFCVIYQCALITSEFDCAFMPGPYSFIERKRLY